MYELQLIGSKMAIAKDNNELIDFAYRIERRMGANLKFLLSFEVVTFNNEWDFRKLLNHLKTNEEFGLVTGFDYNPATKYIWLDSISPALKKHFKGSF